jgi:hypothetical protein
MILRKIDAITKWNNPKSVNRPDPTVPGDTLSELKTKENKLSVWLANSEEDIEDAVVALSLSRDDTDRLCLLLLDEEKLSSFDIVVLDDQEGDAQGASEEILKKHRNLVELDHKRLGQLAEYMIQQANDTNNRKTFSEVKVKNILNKYKGTKIEPQKVKKNIIRKLNWNEDGNT